MPKHRYQLCADLDPESLAEPLSTHRQLSAAFRAHRRYHLWATEGMKYKDSRIVAYITTNCSQDRILEDIASLADSIPRRQVARLVVWQLPKLTPHVQDGYQLPQHRDRDQARHYRKSRRELAEFHQQAACRERADADLLRQIDTPQLLPILGNSQ